MSNTTIAKPWYENTVLRVAAVLGALTVIITSFDKVIDAIQVINTDNIRTTLVILNFIVLSVFCFLLTRIPTLDLKQPVDDSVRKYVKLMNVLQVNGLTLRETVKEKCDKVNMLTTQLNNNILAYAFFLIIVYVLYLFDDGSNPTFYKTGEDICNFLSSVFLYLAFKVLYNKTIGERNKKIIYYVDALFFTFFYLVAYTFVTLKMGSPDKWVHNLSLLSGIFNGLAMGLLFGRFISMEFVFKNQEKIKIGALLSAGTIFILPLYSLVQPLFGSFEIDAFGDPKAFANVVFFICLIGKLFFLYLYYDFLTKKLIHLYFHVVTSRPKVLSDLDDIFD